MVAAKKLRSAVDGRGGHRANAGRPPKLDRDLWGRVTCILRHDTIARLRDGAESRFFGEFLQAHLDRYPVPTREQYLTIQRRGIPVPKAKVVHPWNDKQFSPEERFRLWCQHERERLDKENEQIRARLVRFQPLMKKGRGPHNDKPGKVKSRKPLAHSKR